MIYIFQNLRLSTIRFDIIQKLSIWKYGKYYSIIELSIKDDFHEEKIKWILKT